MRWDRCARNDISLALEFLLDYTQFNHNYPEIRSSREFAHFWFETGLFIFIYNAADIKYDCLVWWQCFCLENEEI